MPFDAGSIVSKLILDKKGWDDSVKTVKKGVKDLGSYIDKNSAKIKSMGRTMTIAGGAMVGAFGLAVKSAISFNKEMANVATLIPNSTARVLELKASVQDLAIVTGKSTGDITEGLYQVISAYGDTAETVEILDTNVRAAAAGMAQTTDAINLTSAVMKGYGDVSAEATAKTADLAFQTVKLGQTTFPELAKSMGKVIPIAAKLNVSQEELFTSYATLTGVTGNAAEVTTQLRGVMTAMMKPTGDMKDAIEALGFTSSETMIAELGLQGSLEALIGTTDGSTESVGKLFESVESLPAVFALTGTQAATFKEKLVEISNSAGAMDEAFLEMSEGINAAGFNMEQLKQMTVVLSQRIGDSLAPTLGKLAITVGEVVSKISDWMKEHPKLTEIIAKAAAGIGLLMLALGPLLMALPGLIAALPLLRKGFLKLVPSLATLKGSISGVSGLLKSMPAIATAAFVGWNVGRAIGKIELLGKSIDDHIVDALGNAIENLGLFQSKVELTGETAEKVAGRIKFLAEHKEKLAEITKKATEKVVELKDKGFKPLEIVAISLADQLAALKKRAEELGVFEDIRTYSERLEDQLWDLRGELANGLITWQEFINKSALITTATGNIKDEFSDLEMALEDGEENWTDYGDTVSTVLEDMGIGMGSIPEETEKAATKTKSLWEDMADGLQTKWASMIGEVLRGATSLKDGLKGVWDSIVVQFTDMIGQMLAKFTANLVSGIISGSATAGSAVATLGGGMATLGTAITSLATGIASILPAIATAIAAAAKILFGALPHILAIGAAAIALYAGFMAVKALFGGGGNCGDLMGKTEMLLEGISHQQLKGILDKLDFINWHNAKFQTRFKSIFLELKSIRKATEGTLKALTRKGTVYVDVFKSTVIDRLGSNISGGLSDLGRGFKDGLGNIGSHISGGLKGLGREFAANVPALPGGSKSRIKRMATGFEGIVDQPTLALMGEAGPEKWSVKPLSQSQPSAPSNVTVYNVVNLNGTMITDRDYTRNRIMPEMLSALKANFEKTNMKQILGIS